MKKANRTSKANKELKTVEFMGCEFVLGKSAVFDKDFETVSEILAKDTTDAVDRATLISIYRASFHDDGKIEGASSCDSSCNGCEFCQKMREAAKGNVRHICNYCYDAAQEARWINVKNRHQLGMLIMSNVRFTERELMRVSLAVITRINSSGDTPNKTYALNMITLAKVNEDACKVAYWAKNAAPIIAACDEIGKPRNLTLVYSCPIINATCPLPKYFDYVFIVASSEERVQEFIKSGACECNGKKCKDCGFKCYKHEWAQGSVIVELLRAKKGQLAAIEAAM